MVSWKLELPPSMITSPFDIPGSSAAIVSSTGFPAGTMIHTMRGLLSFAGISLTLAAAVAPSETQRCVAAGVRSNTTTS
jgi:hypothetical protein